MFFAFSFIFFTILFASLLIIIEKRRNALKNRLEKYLPKDFIESENEITAPNLSKNIMKLLSIKEWEKIFIMILTLIILFLFGFRGVFLLLSIPVGYLLPTIFVKHKRKKRLSLFSEQLAEALGIVANGMRAGFSFMQSLKMVSDEMPEPLGPEFSRTLREIKFGLSFEEAFMGLLQRIPIKELELVVNALLIQRATGGNLAELLETMQETIRGRVRIKEELRTLTAQGRISSWIITILPPAIALYLNFMKPEHFEPLLSHPLGWFMLGSSVTFTVIGWLIIRKIVRIEV